MSRDEFIEERARIADAEKTASQDFDKTVLTLAGGSLGLSMTFINQIAPQPRLIWLLGGAWAVLICSLIALLASFMSSRRAQQRAMEILYAAYEGKDLSVVTNRADRETTLLNWLALWSCMIGVVLLVVFSLVNLPRTTAGVVSSPEAGVQRVTPQQAK